MRPFEYIMVIVSVIVGLTLTQFSYVMSVMFKNYEISVIHWPYISFLFLGFVTALNHWAVLYQLRNVTHWTILSVAVLFLSGMILYAIAIVSTPNEQTFNYDYESLYYQIFPKFCVMTIVMIVILIFESYLLKIERRRSWYFALAGFASLMISGIFIENPEYRNFVGVAMLALQLVNVALNKFNVSDA